MVSKNMERIVRRHQFSSIVTSSEEYFRALFLVRLRYCTKLCKLYLNRSRTMLSTMKPVTKLTALTVKNRFSQGLVKKTKTKMMMMMMTFFPLFLQEVRRVLRKFRQQEELQSWTKVYVYTRFFLFSAIRSKILIFFLSSNTCRILAHILHYIF